MHYEEMCEDTILTTSATHFIIASRDAKHVAIGDDKQISAKRPSCS